LPLWFLLLYGRPAYSRCGHSILQLWFLSFFLLLFFSSPVLNGRKLDVCHTSTHDVASANLGCMSVMCSTRLAKIQDAKITQITPSAHHRRTLLVHTFATKVHMDNWKKLLNSNMSSTCPHNIMNVGPLTAEIGWRVRGTSANFSGFRVIALLLHRRRSTEVNKFCTMFDRLLGSNAIYAVWWQGFCP